MPEQENKPEESVKTVQRFEIWGRYGLLEAHQLATMFQEKVNDPDAYPNYTLQYIGQCLAHSVIKERENRYTL